MILHTVYALSIRAVLSEGGFCTLAGREGVPYGDAVGVPADPRLMYIYIYIRNQIKEIDQYICKEYTKSTM